MASAELVLQALGVLQSPAAALAERTAANQYLEQFKRGDPHAVLSVCASLTNPTLPIEVQVVGYTVLTELVRGRWTSLTSAEHAQVSQLAYHNMTLVSSGGRAAWPLKTKAAVLLSAVVRQQGADVYSQLVPQLLQQAAEGPAQAELACLVLHFISEDLTLFDSVPGESKRLLLAALTASVPSVFPFLCEMLQQNFVAAMQSQKEGASEKLSLHTAVISASLGALTTWVEWTPMARITASNVVDACAFFLTAPEFALQGLDVLKALVHRKRATEQWAEYAGLMDKVAALMLAKAGEMGLLVAPGQLSPALSAQLGWEGGQEELGKRLCALVVSLCESHWRCFDSDQRRLQLLQLLLVFTAHPYLHLAALTFPVWAQMLREAAPNYSTKGGNNEALHSNGPSPPAKNGQRPSESGASAATPAPLGLPLECIQVLLHIMSDLLRRVIILSDSSTGPATSTSGAEADSWGAGRATQGGPAGVPRSGSAASSGGHPSFPEYFDTYQEWREFSIASRAQIKIAMRSACVVAPQYGLALVGQAVQAAVSAAAQSDTPLQARALALSVSAHICEAAVAPLVDAATLLPGAAGVPAPPGTLEQLSAMLQALLTVRCKAPSLVTLASRCIEAFGRLLPTQPTLVTPLVTAVFESMAALPLEAPGQLPPPARSTRAWQQGAEARLALANIVVTLAKAAPAAFAPHLQPLAEQVALMWDTGQLREGERVMLWEGLLMAAAASSPLLSAQMVSWLLSPLAAQWSSPGWAARLASPQAFAQVYMPEEPAAAGASPSQPATFGGRAERWALYHQLTLVERAFRRAAAPPPGPHPGSPPHPASPRGPGSPGHARQGSEGGMDGMSSSGRADMAEAVPQAPHSNGSGAGMAAGSGGDGNALNAHLTWIIPTVAALIGIVHGLSAADGAGVLGKLTGITQLDEVEKAVRLGADLESMAARENKEPRCVAGDAMVDVRYFVRGVREACNITVSLAATHCSAAAFWSNSALAAAVVPAVTSHLESLDHNHMRLLLRHTALPLITRCPPAYQRGWCFPVCAAVIPHCLQRLSSGWAGVVAAQGGSTTAAADGSAPQGKASKQRQEEEEVVTSNLLREVTREHAALLLAMCARPPAPSAAQPSAGQAPGQASVGPGTPAGAPAAQLQSKDGAQHGGDLAAQTVFEALLAAEPGAAQCMVATLVAGLCWPDADSIGKAVIACRYVVGLGISLPPLEEYVCRDLLQSAITSLVQGASATVQPDLLALLRLLLTTYLPRPQGSAVARQTLQQLLQLQSPVLASFEAQLLATNVEKDQRMLIKQLIAQAGGEEIRKLLAAPSMPKLSAASTGGSKAAAAPAAKVQAEADAALQGAICRVIFSE